MNMESIPKAVSLKWVFATLALLGAVVTLTLFQGLDRIA